MMEVSRGTAYGLGISQFAVTLGVVLFLPAVEVVVYVPRATSNTTNGGSLAVAGQGVRVHMAIPLLGVSLLAAVFATVTCKAREQGLSGQDYQPDVVEQMGMWDLLFWLFALSLHGAVGLLVCDPVDLYGAIASTAFLGYFLFQRVETDRNPSRFANPLLAFATCLQCFAAGPFSLVVLEVAFGCFVRLCASMSFCVCVCVCIIVCAARRATQF